MVSLGLPIWLWALGAIAPLIAIYAFHRHARPRQVSSLMLWEGIIRPAAGHTTIHRPPIPISLILEIVAITIMALGVADLRARLGDVRHVPIIILDNSLSMSAVDRPSHAPSALERARERVRTIVGAEGKARLILAEETPRVLGEATPSTLERVWAAWRADAPAADLRTALTSAAQLDDDHPRIAVITDGPPGDAGIEMESMPGLRWISVGASLPNAAIIDAAANPDRIAFDLRAFAGETTTAPISILSGPDALHLTPSATLDSSLPPNELRSFTLDRSDPAAIIAIRIDDDSLAADNTIYLAPDSHPPVRVRIETTSVSLRESLETALTATSDVAIGSAIPELIFTDTPRDPTPGARTVRFELTGDAASGTGRSFAGPYVIDRTTPLTEGLDLTGVIWAIPPIGAVSEDRIIPLVLADTTPIVLEDSHGDLVIRINPDASTLARSTAWPTLIWNLVRDRIEQRPGLDRVNVALGQPVRFRPVSPESPVGVTDPSGQRTDVPVIDGIATILSTSLGIHTIAHADRTWTFAIQPTRLAESDLRSRAPCDLGQWPLAAEESGFRALPWLWALLAMAVLAIHARIMRDGSAAR